MSLGGYLLIGLVSVVTLIVVIYNLTIGRTPKVSSRVTSTSGGDGHNDHTPSAGESRRSWKWVKLTLITLVLIMLTFVLVPYLWFHMRPERLPDPLREVQFRVRQVKTPTGIETEKSANVIVKIMQTGFKFSFYADMGGQKVFAHDLHGESVYTWTRSGSSPPDIGPLRVLKGITRDKLAWYLSHNEPWDGEIRFEVVTPQGVAEYSLNPS